MLSGTAEYALRATLYVAQHGAGGEYVRADRIAEAIGVPRNYLSKILHALARAGILTSTRGPQGGFRLKVDPDRLPIYRVIEPFDTIAPGPSCILGRPECGDHNPCPAHTRWKTISEQVRAFLHGTTLGDLLREEGSLV
jgi:Rrf2 family protein